MIKMKSYLVLVVISFILLPSNFTGNITKEVSFENMRLNLLNYPTNAVNHNPIFIDGNDELAVFIESEDLSGDGTYVSPYIIEDFTINASTADGIFINNTDANLIIRDCTVEGGNHFRYDGIHLTNTTNINISNNELIYNHHGIYLDYSSNITLSENDANNNNTFGIYLVESCNNTLSGNIMYGSGINLYESFDNQIDTSNKVNDKSIRYYENTPGVQLSREFDVGQVILINCNDSIVEGLNISEVSVGVSVSKSVNCFISENIIVGCNYGIYLWKSSNNTLSGNNVNNNTYGIYLWKSSNNTLSGNIVNYNNRYGIFLWESSNNTLLGNNANYNNYIGIHLLESSNNTLSGNNASYNTNVGVWLRRSNNNTLLGNTASYCYWGEGILLDKSCNNTLSGNNANYNHWTGIILISSNNTTLFGNNANNNAYGIYLSSSSNNTISGNNASYNTNVGVWLRHSNNNNIIYYNDICGNHITQGFEDEDCTDNQWDNGTVGNYWGNDYVIKYPDATNNGTVWDTPYEIDGDGFGKDYFPLVKSKFPDFEAPIITNVPGDLSTYEGYSGLNITWIVADLDPATYTIELNGTEAVSGTVWTSGTAISYYIPDGLLEGVYNITIIVLDESGNIVQDTVLFSVIIGYDADEDGMPDSWEEQYNLNPLNASDAEDDPDGDGLTNLEEYLLGLNPRDRDTDNDGIPDNVDFSPNSFFIPTGLIITIFGSVGIIYIILKIIRKAHN